MNSSDQHPKLPIWPFIVTDIALVSAAALIVSLQGGRPSPGWLVTTVACVGAGALFGLLPIVAWHERKKNEALDERQRALEALSRTVAASAEQLSIAAAGLHEIADLAQKNLRHADQLPHKLQDKIAEFQAQLAAANDADREELERELLALRTTESERLETVSQRIAKSSAEWTKLEAAVQQHLAAATDALGKLQLGTANAIGKAQAAAEQALALARTEAARTIGEASGHAARTIDAAKAAAIADFQAAATAAAREAAATLAAELRAKIPSSPTTGTSAAPAAETSDLPAPAPAPGLSGPAPVATTPAPGEPASPASPPRRPRKTRREDAPADAPTESPAADEPSAATSSASTPPVEPAPEEPAPVPPTKFEEITPVAPPTAAPFAPAPPHHGNGEAAPSNPPPPPVAAEPESAKPARKRPVKKTDPDDEEPTLGLDLDDPSSRAAAAGILERVLSSDGATRLLVTAYIGIGNRLFIRGEGPGLSWEKGVPLQFVSIGKWRWETNDASAPVQFRLYKNDDVECSALGTQTLEPGHQQEVTAAF